MTVGVVVDGGASLPEPPPWPLRGVAMHTSAPDRSGEAGHSVSTAAPSPGEFLEAIEAADSGSGVVVVTVASRLSASYEAARLAASLTRTGRVTLVDSGTATAGEGLVALAAARAAAQGGLLDEVAAAAQGAADRVQLVAHLGDVGAVARRGRLQLAADEAPGSGRALVELVGGDVRLVGSASEFDRAQEQIVERVRTSMVPGARLHAGAFHGGRREAAEALLARSVGLAPTDLAFVAELSAVMLAHTGLDVCGLAWWWGDP